MQIETRATDRKELVPSFIQFGKYVGPTALSPSTLTDITLPFISIGIIAVFFFSGGFVCFRADNSVEVDGLIVIERPFIV
jgi:hypothetical protein